MEARKRIEKVKTLPLMNTDDTDLKTGEKTSPRINTDQPDFSGGIGKILPQSVGPEVYADQGQNAEVQANLG
jgi:hypothetical protein